MQREPMTAQGAEKLKAILEQYKTVDRPRVIADIAEARAHGDLKENAEYHAAREEQGFLEAKIKDLEASLSNAQIIDVSTMNNNGKVIFGATVEMINLETDEVKKYQIVGNGEADIKENKISVQSPIARGLVGKEEGDVVAIQTPAGMVEYEISVVEYI